MVCLLPKAHFRTHLSHMASLPKCFRGQTLARSEPNSNEGEKVPFVAVVGRRLIFPHSRFSQDTGRERNAVKRSHETPFNGLANLSRTQKPRTFFGLGEPGGIARWTAVFLLLAITLVFREIIIAAYLLWQHRLRRGLHLRAVVERATKSRKILRIGHQTRVYTVLVHTSFGRP